MFLGAYVECKKRLEIKKVQKDLKRRMNFENTLFEEKRMRECSQKIHKLIKKPKELVIFMQKCKEDFLGKLNLIMCGRQLFKQILLNNAKTDAGNSAITFIEILLDKELSIEVEKTQACFKQCLHNSCSSNSDEKRGWLFNLLNTEENRRVLFQYVQDDDNLCEVLFNAINEHMSCSVKEKKLDLKTVQACTEMQILLKDKVSKTTYKFCKQLSN